MKKSLLLFVMFLFLTSGTASALTVEDLYGDIDGFGIGMAVNATYSGYYPTLSKNDAADVGTITDAYITGDATWSHTYDVSAFGSITAASLEITTYGQGWGALAKLYFDGEYVGTLTDGDTSNPSGYLDTNSSRKDVYSLASYLSLLDGVDTIRIDTTGGWNGDDMWALDYSKLTITGTASVPEPATMLLFGFGLLGLAGVRRKIQK